MLLIEIQDEKYFSRWAKEKAAENRARLGLTQEKDRQLKKYHDDLEKEERRQEREAERGKQRSLQQKITRENLHKVARMIDDAIGQAIPDGDPIDYLIPKLRQLGYKHDISDILDKAIKLVHGKKFKDYYDYLGDAWDNYIDDAVEPEDGELGVDRPYPPNRPDKPKLKKLYRLHSDPNNLLGHSDAKKQHDAELKKYETKMKKYDQEMVVFHKKWAEYEPKLQAWKDAQENPWRPRRKRK